MPAMSEEILVDRQGAAGIITLNRPQRLNALTRRMTGELDAILRDWMREPSVRVVIVKGAGPRAFCAGGDLMEVYAAMRAEGRARSDFYRSEYRLDALIHHYPKPYVALMDGIVMGGGAGISVNGAHRIVTELTQFAMPETGIGFFPDVGASHFLSRLPGECGAYLALTGATISGADAVYLGIGTAYVSYEAFDDLIGDLRDLPRTDDMRAAVAAAIGRHIVPHGVPPIASRQVSISRHFGAPAVETIIESLEAAELRSEFAREALHILRGRSPLGMKVALRAQQLGKQLSLDECLKLEFRAAHKMMGEHDFAEGIRAVLIDRDRAPKWRPDTLAAVPSEKVRAMFEPIEVPDLIL